VNAGVNLISVMLAFFENLCKMVGMQNKEDRMKFM